MFIPKKVETIGGQTFFGPYQVIGLYPYETLEYFQISVNLIGNQGRWDTVMIPERPEDEFTVRLVAGLIRNPWAHNKILTVLGGESIIEHFEAYTQAFFAKQRKIDAIDASRAWNNGLTVRPAPSPSFRRQVLAARVAHRDM